MSLAKKRFIIYSIFIVIISAALITVVAVTGRVVFRNGLEERLVSSVNAQAETIEKRGSYLSVGADFAENEVHFALYSDGKLIAGVDPVVVEQNEKDGDKGERQGDGENPQGQQTMQPEQPFFPQADPEGKVRLINAGGTAYLTYSRVVVVEEYGPCILKGAVKMNFGAMNTVLWLFCAGVAAIAVVAVIVSYVTYRNATDPILKLTEEMGRVENSKDLKKRVEIETKDVDIKKLCDAYNKMLERVESILKSQERFTSDVSHELRSPLTVLLAESEFALNDLKTAEEKDKSLAAIYAQTQRLTVMVRQLLDFSRVVGTESVALTETDISTLTKEIAEMTTNDKDIAVKCDVEDKITVKTDETLFIRMITNLIDNAVKYGKQGGNVEVGLKRTDGGATLIVKDDGIGMDKETLSHIYERMYQANKSRSEGSGLGLGLSFVKEISRILGCSIEVESELGVGTAFTVRFGK